MLDVTADVREQRVLLTGTLDDPQVRKEVVQLLREDPRVREVCDQIQMVSTSSIVSLRNIPIVSGPLRASRPAA